MSTNGLRLRVGDGLNVLEWADADSWHPVGDIKPDSPLWEALKEFFALPFKDLSERDRQVAFHAWQEGHETPWERKYARLCECDAWNASECGCGSWDDFEIVTTNPYLSQQNDPNVR